LLLDDEAFLAPFVPFFDPRFARRSTPIETHLRMMFRKFWFRLDYKSLCPEVVDPITWRRFCRIPFDGTVPHPATLVKALHVLSAASGDHARVMSCDDVLR
jgi:IS5 family transposase